MRPALRNAFIMRLVARHRYSLMLRALHAALDVTPLLPLPLPMGGSTGSRAAHPGITPGRNAGIHRGAVHALMRIQLPLLLQFSRMRILIHLHPRAILRLFHAHLGLFHVLMPLKPRMCRRRGA